MYKGSSHVTETNSQNTYLLNTVICFVTGITKRTELQSNLQTDQTNTSALLSAVERQHNKIIQTVKLNAFKKISLQ